jgi:prolyl-tRNA editing enzyme YbaK/EbsC (Cys-tRNA(Pro) deacylase)
MALDYVPALDKGELLADPVTGFLQSKPAAAALLQVAEIDPDLADTAAFCEKYGIAMDVSANCVIIAGKRGETITYAACMVLATTRVDVNGVVRKRLDAKKASFASMDDAVTMSGMEYGGITPFGLPPEWPVLVDSRVLDCDFACYGSGLRRSKLFGPGKALLEIPSVEVIEGLANPLPQ